MEHPDGRRPQGRESFIALLLAGLCGGGFLLFLILVSGGFFFYVLCAAAIVGGVGFLHYVVWGQAMTDQTAGEREEEELRQRSADDDW